MKGIVTPSSFEYSIFPRNFLLHLVFYINWKVYIV